MGLDEDVSRPTVRVSGRPSDIRQKGGGDPVSSDGTDCKPSDKTLLEDGRRGMEERQ